jgi:Uma2 family endonuclease
VTKRNRWHSKTEARITGLLDRWLCEQPEPRGELYAGEAGFRLRRNPDSSVGIDVAYVSSEVASRNPQDTRLIDGIPVLAVEILSPYDTQEEVEEKLDLYLEVGVPLIWIVDPHFRTVTVYRPGAEPEMFNVTQQLSGEPHLPGFVVPVAKLFGR